MTLVLPRTGPAPADVAWRPLGPTLWVGRSSSGPAGTIERGRRFVVTDAEGVRRGAYSTLEAAIAGYGQWRAEDELPDGRSWEPLALVTTIAGAAGALLAIYAALGI